MVKGTTNYCTKEELYRYVNGLRKLIFMDTPFKPMNFYEICSNISGIKMEKIPFHDRSLRGMSVPKDNIILLNLSRTPEEMSFDCCHEFIHVVKHKKETSQTFNCFDKLRPQQNCFLEWQANEGSAEFLVPYKEFIPLFCNHSTTCRDILEYRCLKEHLASYFFVPYAVINLRIDNLKYEIYQYKNGVDIDSIKIKSNTQLVKEGIHIASPNAVFDFIDWAI